MLAFRNLWANKSIDPLAKAIMFMLIVLVKDLDYENVASRGALIIAFYNY